MRMLVCSVLDKAVAAYLQPFFVRSKLEAIRSFSSAVNDGKSPFGMHPSDYVLVSLGEFDDNSGLFFAGEPERLISAVECLDVGQGQPTKGGQAL